LYESQKIITAANKVIPKKDHEIYKNALQALVLVVFANIKVKPIKAEARVTRRRS